MKPTKNQELFLPYLKNNRKALLQRDFLAEIFTTIEPVPIVTIGEGDKAIVGFYSRSAPYVGKLIFDEKTHQYRSVRGFKHLRDHDRGRDVFYSVVTEAVPFGYIPGEPLTHALIEMTVGPGEIENRGSLGTLQTTVGRFIANYVLFASVFGARVPYYEGIFKPGKVQDLLPVDDPQAYSKHIDHRQYLTSCPEFYAGNLTPHALKTSPKIKGEKAKDLQEHKKFFEENDPIKCSQFENKWMKLDHEYLKGDSSNIFLQDSKLRTNSRKKMFITNGLRERFGSVGQYDFTANSLEEGWVAKEFPALVNEARMGSYNRARQTAKGGEESKFIIRVFQNTRVTEDDCQTQNYYKLLLKDHNVKDYFGRTIRDGNKDVVIGPTNATTYIGKVVNLRSPLYCKAKKNGYCFTCMGDSFKKTGQDAIAAVMTEIGSQMLKNSLKSMHNSTTVVNKLKNLNEYIVSTPR